MCNPDSAPVVDDPAPPEAAGRDTRSNAQRNHNALNAALRALLGSWKPGQHNGLPANFIGTLVPMSDVIRLPRHAHYLAIFDDSKPIGLYHTKRLASPGQRIVLYAKDRVCTRPARDPTVRSPATGVKPTVPTGGRPPAAPASPRSRWPAGPTTGPSKNKAGRPDNAPTANPNGFHPPTSTTDNHEPTPSTAPRNCSRQTTAKTTRKRVPARQEFGYYIKHSMKFGMPCEHAMWDQNHRKV